MDREKWAKAMEEVEAELEKVRRRLLLAEDFDEMEAVVAEMGPAVERMVLAAGVEQREGMGGQRCPECGGKLKVEGRAQRQLKTSRGVVKYRRRRWVYESCGATIFPLDRELGVGPYRQTSHRLERMVCEVGMRLPYEQSAQVIEELVGVKVSDRQVEHIVDWHGQRAVEAAWKAPEPIGRQPAGPQVLYIEGDGAWVNGRTQSHLEGKVGVVHQGPERIGRRRMRLREAVYVTTFESFERLGEERYLEADRQGLERAKQVIFLSDGALGLREIHQTHFHDARYVLDWFHLRQELRRALRGVATELGDDYEAVACITLKDLLWFGEIDLALERLDRLRAKLAMGNARDAITAFKGYILNNRHGIGYAELYEQGIHVGSGPIEKTGDLIFNRPCELRGMAWYPDTANGVCNLRALRFNSPDRWTAFWQ